MKLLEIDVLQQSTPATSAGQHSVKELGCSRLNDERGGGSRKAGTPRTSPQWFPAISYRWYAATFILGSRGCQLD
jgi:hypothetical protein